MAGIAAAIVGCDASGEGGSTPTSTLSVNGRELAKSVPTGFDPCTDVPEQVLTEERLYKKEPTITEAPGGVVWKGCGWVYRGGGGYTLSVRMTNLTVPMVRERHFQDAAEFSVGGREAISTRQFEGPNIKDVCTVNVAVQAGSVEFTVVNPPSGRDTGHLDSCQIARSLTERIAPSIPGSL
ncbi:DUF3558 domain-containing protein [Nocardia sp. NPDC057663]|uniref:DUF3558 domain-containing protein n=1 Tax=Nocardia sp. NPDC057663 TaxID=3346201 RepID=UPI00366BCB67